MDKVDIVVVGAGVVGLAVSERLASRGCEVAVLERHDGFGREASSRNSEVIHTGIYYPEGTLKGRLCVEGSHMLYELCDRVGIPHAKPGKIVVAGDRKEIPGVEHLLEQGRANGTGGLRMLSCRELKDMEPEVNGEGGLFSPDTGIVDTHRLMRYLEQSAETHGAVVAYGCEVTRLRRDNGCFVAVVRDTDGDVVQIRSQVVVNAAGLSCDSVAHMAGIDPDSAGYRIHPCKGEYFSISGRHRGKVSHLVYPAPTTVSLGIHLVLGLDGSMRLGPNAFYVDAVDYDVNPAHREEFHESGNRYLPFLERDDISPDMAGIRPKLQKPGGPFRDFVIAEESASGVPGLIDLVGIESPGLTSCLAIAARVERMVRDLGCL